MKQYVITEKQLKKYENGGYNEVILREIRSHLFSTELNKILKELEDYCNDEGNLIHKPAECGGFCDPTLNQEVLLEKINSIKLNEERE